MTTQRRALGDIGTAIANQQNLGRANAKADLTAKGGDKIVSSRATAANKVDSSASAPRVSSCILRNSRHSSNQGSPRVDDKYRPNPLWCADYIANIVDDFRVKERERPPYTYLSDEVLQPEINEKMRTVLVDWLVEVHLKFKLQPETLYLTVDIIDRYLQQRSVPRRKLQLVGVVAMLLASKYEEIFPPEVNDFVYIAAHTYTREEMLALELDMLRVLDFNLTVPTTFVFLRRGLQVIEADKTTQHLAFYISELSLMDYQSLRHLPSKIASACIYIARLAQNSEDPWNKTLEHYGKYQVEELRDCAQDLLSLLSIYPVSKYQGVYKKYSWAKFGEVAKMIDPKALPILP